MACSPALVKSPPEQARALGGTADEPLVQLSQKTDTLDHIDRTALGINGAGVAYAVARAGPRRLTGFGHGGPHHRSCQTVSRPDLATDPRTDRSRMKFRLVHAGRDAGLGDAWSRAVSTLVRCSPLAGWRVGADPDRLSTAVV